jgi:hypothetical protein
MQDFAYKNATIVEFEQYFEQKSGVDLSEYFKSWIETTGYADFSLDDYTIKDSLDGYRINLDIRQQELARDYLMKNQKLELMLLDSANNQHFYSLDAGNELTKTSVFSDFKPECVVLDPYNKLCDAQFSYSPYLKGKEIWTNNYIYLSLEPTILSTDSLQVFISYHYVSPYNDNSKSEFMSEYWRIDIPKSENQRITANFYLPPQVRLRQLYYRANAQSEWTFLPNQSTQHTEFVTNNLKSGEYAFGRL